MRRALSSLSSEGAMELLLQKVREFPSNEQFLESLRLG
jgi:transcription termination factor Rho